MYSRLAAKAHVFVGDLDGPELAPGDLHHLERVLRLRPGEPVTASDGRGSWRPFVWAADGALAPDGDVVVEARPAPEVTVAFALTKGERPELVTQKLTEAGVDRIVPFVAGRSVVRWDAERASRNVERLRIVAREAAMQSRRAWLPEVAELASFTEAAAQPGAALAEVGGGGPTLDRPTVLVGPEGGWTDEERACGLPVVGLGPNVCRAETAAIAAGVLLAALRSGLVGDSFRQTT
jgi:16S rRNA (uracil1498-N3)-methyltransferase